MIFSEEHIEKIRNWTKTQTQRVNRGIYQVGKDYAVQPGKGERGIPNLRVVIDEVQREERFFGAPMPISFEDALAEGGYSPDEFEKLFQQINPKWNGLVRWAFKFHVKEVMFS